MPNWVYNNIYIEGKKENVQVIVDLLGKPYKNHDNGVINFLNLIAPPDEHWAEYDCGNIRLGGDEEKNPWNWYDWNTTNWHTKWNACADMGGGIDDWHDLPNGLSVWHVRFDTAWSPPLPVINKIVDIAVNLDCSVTYHYEEEQGWGGEVAWDETGIKFVNREWDIPASHAENEEHDRTCICEYELDQDYWFSDCPRPDQPEVAEVTEAAQ